MSRLGPRSCWCCGQSESRGCIVGFACRCQDATWKFGGSPCLICSKCPAHCECTVAELEKKADELAANRAYYLAGCAQKWADFKRKAKTAKEGQS